MNLLDSLTPQPKIINPLLEDGQPMLKDNAAYVADLRTVRRNAKKAARSGNPAKRFPALKVLGQVPHIIAATYRKDASEQLMGVNR